MTDIRDIDSLDQLESWILNTWDRVKELYEGSFEVPEGHVDRLEINEVIIGGEAGRGTGRDVSEALDINLIIDSNEDVPTSRSNAFNEVAPNLAAIMEDEDIREETEGISALPMEIIGAYDGVSVRAAPLDRVEDVINQIVQIREGEPNRAYSLTRDENIIITGEGIRRRPAYVRISRSERDVDPSQNASILDYPELDDLRQELIRSFSVAQGQVAQDRPERADDIDQLTLENLVFIGEFANGTAEMGVDPFEVVGFIEKPSFFPLATRIYSNIAEAMSDEFEPTEAMMEWASGIDIDMVDVENYDSVLVNNLDPDVGRAYDIIDRNIIRLQESDVAGYNVVEESELGEEPEEEEEEPEPEPDFPGIPPELRPFAVDDDELNVPINKDSKRVAPRALYDFEREMLTPGDAETSIPGTIDDGIGWAKRIGAFGQQAELPDGTVIQAVPSSFPRTGAYIKYHLLYQGPSYILEMYRDMVVYSAYISTIYEGRYVVGGYDSFREYMYRLRQVYERGLGPELIRQPTQQELAAQGLSREPELPNGQPAPWLENREYYEVVEENIDHVAWYDVAGFLYENGVEG